MNKKLVSLLNLVALMTILLWGVVAAAQEATLEGHVTDAHR
jgi:hypothetical protein